MGKQRDLVKQLIRLYSSADVPTWEAAAEKVGLSLTKLAWWRRQSNWEELCREVAEEELTVALPVAVRRLVETARTDKTSSGVTAAKTLVDMRMRDDADGQASTEGAISDEINLAGLTEKERELTCKLLAKLTGRGAGGDEA